MVSAGPGQRVAKVQSQTRACFGSQTSVFSNLRNLTFQITGKKIFSGLYLIDGLSKTQMFITCVYRTYYFRGECRNNVIFAFILVLQKGIMCYMTLCNMLHLRKPDNTLSLKSFLLE